MVVLAVRAVGQLRAAPEGVLGLGPAAHAQVCQALSQQRPGQLVRQGVEAAALRLPEQVHGTDRVTGEHRGLPQAFDGSHRQVGQVPVGGHAREDGACPVQRADHRHGVQPPGIVRTLRHAVEEGQQRIASSVVAHEDGRRDPGQLQGVLLLVDTDRGGPAGRVGGVWGGGGAGTNGGGIGGGGA